jgi:hypothetical protein
MPGIQLLVTALGYEDECKYLNLRLRMEQQRLFAWSETSGLLDLDASSPDKVINSDVFNMHRQTVLDLLVQIKCLFDEFTTYQRKYNRLKAVEDEDGMLGAPERDAKQANFPISKRKTDFIRKAMAGLRSKSSDGLVRLRWASFDKQGFEGLLARFAALNDGMTSILDHALQAEIRDTVQDTNRGVLLLHHKIADLSHLVLALKSQLEGGQQQQQPAQASRVWKREQQANEEALRQLSRLAKFKAFNETIDPKSAAAAMGDTPVDAVATRFLDLAKPGQQRNLYVPRYMVQLDADSDNGKEEAESVARCEGYMRTEHGRKRVWIEWKDYDRAAHHDNDDDGPDVLSKADIVDRVRKLAALLNHSPKPESFRTPHCLGFFDKADPEVPSEDVDILDRRLGLIFERPDDDDGLDAHLPPMSLHELLEDTASRKPSVTERIGIAHALSNCLLYLHAVNWLHKGLRSHNVLFFRTQAVDGGGGGRVDYGRPYLSGFDFSRPGGEDEMTDVPSASVRHDLYRHPRAQAGRGTARERSKKSFDVYSLGVVLVELAHWSTVDYVLDVDVRRPDAARAVRHRLLAEDSIADVAAAMGQRFAGATSMCLAEGDEGEDEGETDDDDDVAARLSMRFYNDVVKTLEGVVV